ncbi:MAG: dTDP-4-dehydrorhamnose reductase [Immundisolibacterales bacterium]|nr:dTDP-4-dehydrorhamnose reductase [Immundisolibacterales bacterium]
MGFSRYDPDMLHELSERPRILLIGADGQLGWELRRTASPLGDVIATVENDSRRRNVSGELLDLSDHGAIRRVVADVKPHVILNAAAFTDIDQTERESAVATAINGVAPGLLAREASRYEALLVHYSTDNVFDGELDRPYRPSDSPRPANTYGATKLQGEEAIRAIGGPHYILRTSWLYGARGNNFLMTMLDLVDAGRPISVVSDQFGAPTWTRSVAAATVQILALARVAGAAWMRERFGTYHMTAGGRCSWYEFAAAILDRYRDGEHELTPQSTSSFPASAGRPANGVLDCTDIRRAFGIVLDDWRTSLERVMEEVLETRGRAAGAAGLMRTGSGTGARVRRRAGRARG